VGEAAEWRRAAPAAAAARFVEEGGDREGWYAVAAATMADCDGGWWGEKKNGQASVSF